MIRTMATGLSLMTMAYGAGVGSAYAQGESESSIEFAPDEPFEEPVAPAAATPTVPTQPRVGPPALGSRPSRQEPLDPNLVGPPAPRREAPRISLESPARPLAPRPKTGADVFGRYRIRLGGAQPVFSDRLKYYKELYGNPSIFPVFAADWFAWDWYVTMGLSLRTGYYTAEGKAATSRSGPSSVTTETLSIDQNSTTSLTLIPTQAALAAQFTPFPQKWLVIDGWYGLERLYFQEVRSGGGSATKTAGQAMLANASSSDTSLTNSGWKSSRISGVAVNILLNPLDEVSAQSMRSSMGLSSIYLSPFVEVIQQMSSGIDFSRINRGVTFTFETLY